VVLSLTTDQATYEVNDTLIATVEGYLTGPEEILFEVFNPGDTLVYSNLEQISGPGLVSQSFEITPQFSIQGFYMLKASIGGFGKKTRVYVVFDVEITDTDGDGVPDDQDVCPGFDDNVDSDSDSIPNGCDICPLDSGNDADGDGLCSSAGDCNDTNSGVYTGATETCNGIDDNCANGVDEGFNVGGVCFSLPNSCGDNNTGSFACTVDGTGSECNALPPDERDGFGDICASSSNNCGDTNVGFYGCADVGVVCSASAPADRSPATAYIDNDNDGYGDISSPIDVTCGVPSGVVENGLDCDDSESVINPDAIESANGIDDNCDGVVDEGVPVCTSEDEEQKLHFMTTHESVDSGLLRAKGELDSYEGSADDDIFVYINGVMYEVGVDTIPVNSLIEGMEIESTELVPLTSNVIHKNTLKVKGLKHKDSDNLFAYSGRYFSLWDPFFNWVYSWDTATVDASGDSDYDGFASLNITTSDKIKIHLDLKSNECKIDHDEDTDDDGVPDSIDEDDDDDGIVDADDICTKDGVLNDCSKDFDNDGLDDRNDDDDDNDGKHDKKDKHAKNRDKK